MKDKILVIEDQYTKISSKYDYFNIVYQNQTKDSEIHNWLIPKINDINKIIIPVRLGLDDTDYKGLRIGLHLRLTPELKDKRYIPIIFISEESKEEILQNQISHNEELTALLLFTDAVYTVDIFSLQDKIDFFSLKINNEILKKDVLPNLIIRNERDLGHQLANEWGAFRLAKFAGINLNLALPKSLFFKFKYAQTEIDIIPIEKKQIGLLDKNSRILLIDDNAKKGWNKILYRIISDRILAIGKKNDFNIIDTYEEATEIANFSIYDLIFLDLRMKLEEDKPNFDKPIEEYSGAKLLEKIKSDNQGIQVIVFTASNKAWNMKKLLELGADGYYIKESPEYQFSEKFSEENYKNLLKSIEKCIERNYLKGIWHTINEIKKNNNKLYPDFNTESDTMLDLSWELLKNERNDFAFLTLFQVIELYAKYEYQIDGNIEKLRSINKTMFDKMTGQWELTFDETKGYFLKATNPNGGNHSRDAFFKISAILAYILNKGESFLKKFGKLNKIRNDIAHEGAKKFTSIEDIKELLAIITEFREITN